MYIHLMEWKSGLLQNDNLDSSLLYDAGMETIRRLEIIPILFDERTTLQVQVTISRVVTSMRYSNSTTDLRPDPISLAFHVVTAGRNPSLRDFSKAIELT